MTKIYCDKCKKEIINRIIVTLPCDDGYDNRFFMGLPAKEYDLCDNCFNKLKKWIDEE